MEILKLSIKTQDNQSTIIERKKRLVETILDSYHNYTLNNEN